jgi:regulatory protein YycH of two-component signal transduction system YycFG
MGTVLTTAILTYLIWKFSQGYQEAKEADENGDSDPSGGKR